MREQLNDALKQAMKARDQRTTSTLRMVLAKLKDKDIEARGTGKTDGIDDAAVLSVLQGMVKQRRDSIAMYTQGGRQDLVDQENEEIAIIERFLPTQMSPAEAEAAIKAVIAELGAAGPKDMGRVMAELKGRHAGQMDFQQASGLVKAALAAAG
jgi:uncharacterized protein YqeY